MKKVLVVLLALCFLLATSTAYAADYAIAGGIPAKGNTNATVKMTGNQGGGYEYMLMVNNRVLNINKTKIYMSGDEIMVPIRDVLKGLGFQVRWNGEDRTITAHQADEDFFTFKVDQKGIEMSKGTAYISLDLLGELELLEETLEDVGVDLDVDVEEGGLMVRGNKTFTSVGVITITGGIEPLGQGGGAGPDGPQEPDEDSMTGFITDIFDDIEDLLEDLTEDEDELEALEAELDALGFDDLAGGIELDEEITFLVDKYDTMIELLDEADAEFDDLEEGMWVKVSYQDDEVAEDAFVADEIEEIEESTEGRVQGVLDDEDAKDELGLSWSELGDLEDELYMDDTEGGLLLNGDRMFLISDDTEILDEEGGDIDLDDLEDEWLVRVTYHGPKVEDDPKTYLAKKVEVLAESMLGYITDILSVEEAESVLDIYLEDIEDDYDMEDWLGAVEIDDDVLFLIGDDTELYDEDDEEIDFGDLEDRYEEEELLVLVTYDRDDVDDDPETYVARMVEIREETVTGRIYEVYGDVGDETGILVDLDDGEYTLFLIGDDTEVDVDLEVDADVKVTYFDELLDDNPDEYAAKIITEQD